MKQRLVYEEKSLGIVIFFWIVITVWIYLWTKEKGLRTIDFVSLGQDHMTVTNAKTDETSSRYGLLQMGDTEVETSSVFRSRKSFVCVVGVYVTERRGPVLFPTDGVTTP